MRTDAIPFRSQIAHLAGAVIGATVAVNTMILSGVERGHEAGPGEVFEQSSITGFVVTRWIRRSG